MAAGHTDARIAAIRLLLFGFYILISIGVLNINT